MPQSPEEESNNDQEGYWLSHEDSFVEGLVASIIKKCSSLDPDALLSLIEQAQAVGRRHVDFLGKLERDLDLDPEVEVKPYPLEERQKAIISEVGKEIETSEFRRKLLEKTPDFAVEAMIRLLDISFTDLRPIVQRDLRRQLAEELKAFWSRA